jgi:hypothetical protein
MSLFTAVESKKVKTWEKGNVCADLWETEVIDLLVLTAYTLLWRITRLIYCTVQWSCFSFIMGQLKNYKDVVISDSVFGCN